MVTWDNTTGMNPYHDDFDNVLNLPVTKLSYGEMLHKTCYYAAPCLTDLLTNSLKYPSADEFEKLIDDDWRNPYCGMAKVLASWWHIDHLLSHPDILDYDYICLRQTDTLFHLNIDTAGVMNELSAKNRKIFDRDNTDHKIPFLADFGLGFSPQEPYYPCSTFMPSHAYILNRSAVEIIKKDFYQNALSEINHYHTLLGHWNKINFRKPGLLMHKLIIKLGIESLSLSPLIFNPKQLNRDPAGASMYGRNGGYIDHSCLDKQGTRYHGRIKDR